ncbi:nucleic-acid-binding protein from transposon X-element [Trichonephila clavipes]|nr:nucleic-acid-binding protein from transposon X-element [Trichonephila clavipes]
MFSTDHEEYRTLIHFLESDKEFEFYVLKRQKDKPIKAVIKGLPNSSKINDITNYLKEIGFKIDSCTQLISKRTKKSLPYFLIILPRNHFNSKIFDIVKLGYLQVKVDGYLVRGITQCFNCNNFYHTAANCYMRPRCLKCGKDHATKNCHIKERQENPFCINCQDFGHSACYTKCPKFPQPKKDNASCTTIGPPFLKSRPTLQAQVSKIKKIRVPDRDWRIVINVDKSQAILFRKWVVIDPPFQLTVFDDNIQWASVVCYLGLHIDSRLTYKKHIKYLADKFCGKIHLAISLIGRRLPLSLENKAILYKKFCTK